MKKIVDEVEQITELINVDGKIVVDVGCGNGRLVRGLTGKGAIVTGIDQKSMLEKAEAEKPAGNESYIEGGAEHIPMDDDSVDYIIYFASFHHVPEEGMKTALEETYRVLKPGGQVIFLEPVGVEGSYFELIRLVEDERIVQQNAKHAIVQAALLGFKQVKEEMYYYERSLEDYGNLIDMYVGDEKKRISFKSRAEEITKQLCMETGNGAKDYRYRSIARLNILEK